MKLRPRYFIAAPFFALSAFLLFSSLSALLRSSGFDWGRFFFTAFMSALMVLCPGVVGMLALKRRWEDFVKIIGFLSALFLFSFVYSHTSGLARTTEDLISADYPLLGALWGGCVVFAPFAVSIGAYKLFVPLIIRRIYRNITPAGSSFPPEPHASSRA